MNQHQRFRHQQSHQYSNPRQSFQQSTSRATSFRQEQLERELYALERELIALDAQIDALREKGRLLEDAKRAHQASVPFAIAQVALSTLGVRYLPPVARTWHSKNQHYLRAEEQLKQYALTLATRRQALLAQIEYVETQIEMLQYHP